jgi:thiol-disulfide isomerase/thioredoxin
MRAMRRILLAVFSLACGASFAAGEPLTEHSFRKNLGFGAQVRMAYRGLDCRPVKFDGFAAGMRESGAHADLDRSADGREVTMTVRKRGLPSCVSPYPPITSLPPFDLEDLAGKRVTAAGLRGKPTLISFFFSTCVPCILEVQPLNEYAAGRPDMNFLAVTFDEPQIAQAFANRFDFRWRIVPDARDFIDRVRVKNYPMVALFDAKGRLLGTRMGGASNEIEAARVKPALTEWVEELQRQSGSPTAPK